VEKVVMVVLQITVLLEPQTSAVVVGVEELMVIREIILVNQAVRVSSSLNTSPNLITKSSNHQAHGLHPVALLRSST
jgi:hypothetical protein